MHGKAQARLSPRTLADPMISTERNKEETNDDK